MMEEDVNLKFDGYDEDLNENLFFKYIQTKHKSLYDDTAKYRWIICVPRKGTLSRSNHTLKDVENHFLQPTEGESSHAYTTLNGKSVKVNEGFIFTEKGFEDVKYVRILFEETFFNGNNESYQVLCLDQPLEGGIGVSADPVVQALDNLQGCIDFLWPSTGTKQGQKQIDEIIRLFNSTYQQLEGESMRHLMDAANAIYTRAMQQALKNTQLRKLSQSNKSYLDNIKLAIETYVIHGLYTQLMKGISCIVGNEDAALNKITRNLADIQIRDLGIKPDICTNLPRGRRMLSFLNRFTSPLEKFHCLKKSITLITERKMKDKEAGVVDAITADDLLPALVFLVIKSDIPNWLANITFLHNFHFSKCGYNEFQFYLSSLEAAVEHVRSGCLTNTFKGGIPFKRLQNGNGGSYSFWQPVDFDSNKPTALDMLFEYTAQGKEQEVEKLLGNEEKENLRLDKMCHPLCSCDKCEKLLSKRRNDPSAVTVFSRDDMGRTVLHVAAEYGHTNLTYSLIHKGAVVNTMDYHGSTPLHMACLRGHSKVVLILLHYKADVNALDNDGNTPMHLCVANGHDQCCKSLVYSDMNHPVLKINVANENGDTPLHLAARWGYVDLVNVLIERGASIEVRNRNKQSPLDCAHSQQVSEIILDAAAAHIEKETGFLAFLPDEEVKHPSRSLRVPIRGSTGSSLAGSPASSLERHSPKEVDVFLRTVADGDIEMVRFRLSLEEEDEEDAGDVQCISEMDLCHPLCQCDKCIKWQKLTSRSLEDNIHVNCSNKDGITPLHVAAVRGYTAIATLLLRHGADPDAKNNNKQQTPLHLACQYNHHEVVELLLNYSAKINMKDYKGNTPLHFCCLNGHMAPALVLLERNVSVDVPNDRGNTPLHEASRWNYCDLVRVLLEHGACANIRNKVHLTPMQFAKHDDVVKVFQQSVKITKESLLTRRKTWAGLSMNSNVKHDVSLPNPVESSGTPPKPTHQQASTSSVRVSYSNATKTVEMEEKPRTRSLTASSICDTTIEQPQTKLSKIFEHLEHGEVERLQEIAKAVRAFDRRKSLKRAVTIDKSLPFFAANVDREILDEIDQDALRNDTDLFDQPIVPPNNTPINPSPSSGSSPLLDRVRNVLLDDPSTRTSEGPLLDRVKSVLQAADEEIRPDNGYATNDSSLEYSKRTENSRRSNLDEDVSEGAVLESAHPELVSIVEREIEVIDQVKGSKNSNPRDLDSHSKETEDHELTSNIASNSENDEVGQTFEKDYVLPGRGDVMIDSVNHVNASNEAVRSLGCETHPSGTETYTSGEDLQEGDRETQLDGIEVSTYFQVSENQGLVDKGTDSAQQVATGTNDSLSSIETCRVLTDCQRNDCDSNQNNNVDAKCGCEPTICETSNDNHETKFIGDHDNVSDKVDCELMSEPLLYDVEIGKMSPDKGDSKSENLLESVKICETSTPTVENDDSLDSIESRGKSTNDNGDPMDGESNELENRETSTVNASSNVTESDNQLIVENRETKSGNGDSSVEENDTLTESVKTRKTDDASATVTESDNLLIVENRETRSGTGDSTIEENDTLTESVKTRETDDASPTVTESDNLLIVENRETKSGTGDSTVGKSDTLSESVKTREISTDDGSSKATRETIPSTGDSTVGECDGLLYTVEARETTIRDSGSISLGSDVPIESLKTRETSTEIKE